MGYSYYPPLKDCLAGNRIEKVYGIVNGTTNYILTQMERGDSYESALKKLKSVVLPRLILRPTCWADAARKIAILASIAFGARAWKAMNCVGIERLEPLDLAYARELGK